MTQARSFYALDLATQLARGYYLRTGHLLKTEIFLKGIQRKFNHDHDPHNGQFTFGLGGGSFDGNSPAASMGVRPAGVPTPVQQSARRRSGEGWNPSVPIAPIREIAGYPQSGRTSWRSQNDLVFSAAADFYNRKYKLRPGDLGFRTPEFMKAWAMRESGGEGDSMHFFTDPFQVNKNLDWNKRKIDIAGLRYGQSMTPASSAYAVLEWLRYKQAIHDTQENITGFRTDQLGLERYNGNPSPVREAGNIPHYRWYAATIVQMAAQAALPKAPAR